MRSGVLCVRYILPRAVLSPSLCPTIDRGTSTQTNQMASIQGRLTIGELIQNPPCGNQTPARLIHSGAVPVLINQWWWQRTMDLIQAVLEVMRLGVWRWWSWGSSCVLSADQDDRDVPPPHLFGNLAPGTAVTEGGVQTVVTHGVLQTQAVR